MLSLRWQLLRLLMPTCWSAAAAVGSVPVPQKPWTDASSVGGGTTRDRTAGPPPCALWPRKESSGASVGRVAQTEVAAGARWGRGSSLAPPSAASDAPTALEKDQGRGRAAGWVSWKPQAWTGPRRRTLAGAREPHPKHPGLLPGEGDFWAEKPDGRPAQLEMVLPPASSRRASPLGDPLPPPSRAHASKIRVCAMQWGLPPLLLCALPTNRAIAPT